MVKIAAILRLYRFACRKLNKARQELNEAEISKWKPVKMRFIEYDSPYWKECARQGMITLKPH